MDKRKAGSGFVRASDGAKVSYQPPVKGPAESLSRTRPVLSNEDEVCELLHASDIYLCLCS